MWHLLRDAHPHLVKGIFGGAIGEIITFPSISISTDTPVVSPGLIKREFRQTTAYDVFFDIICGSREMRSVPSKISGSSIRPSRRAISRLVSSVGNLLDLQIRADKVHLPMVGRGFAVKAHRFNLGRFVAQLDNTRVAVAVRIKGKFIFLKNMILMGFVLVRECEHPTSTRLVLITIGIVRNAIHAARTNGGVASHHFILFGLHA
jgi:hypothetical protein